MITWEIAHARLTFLGLQRNVTFISGLTIWEVIWLARLWLVWKTSLPDPAYLAFLGQIRCPGSTV